MKCVSIGWAWLDFVRRHSFSLRLFRYSKLISTLLRWRSENASLLLETEVDALNRDLYDNTPLHWACAKGHRKAVQQLVSWNPAAIQIFNLKGETPEDCARCHGFEGILKQPVQVFDPKSR